MQKLPLCRALARRYLLVWDLRLSKGRGLRSGRHQNTTNKDTENWNFADDRLDRIDGACDAAVEIPRLNDSAHRASRQSISGCRKTPTTGHFAKTLAPAVSEGKMSAG
jgi:hypothetical protein